MKKTYYLLITFFSLILLHSCSKPAPNKASSTELSGTLTLSGSSTVAPIANAVAKEFEKLYPKIKVNVQTGGSSKGLNDALNGIVDIGMSSRDLSPKEKTKLYSYPIASDGICLIIHKDNPIRQLSYEQTQKIYKKEITNWSSLGGKNEEITVINKAAGRATLKVFSKYYSLRNKDIKADIIIGDNEHAIKTILGNPNAIAYVSIGSAEYHVQNSGNIVLLAEQGVLASTQNVANGSFPISRSLILATKNNKNKLAQKFINFFKTQQAKQEIEKLYFVPIQTEALASVTTK